MGLQATAASKRKHHEITFDGKDAATASNNSYSTTNCPPPLKATKLSMNNNNYIEALEEQQMSDNAKLLAAAAGANTTTHSSNKIKEESVFPAKKCTTSINNNNAIKHNNNNNNNNESKSCSSACYSISATTNQTSPTNSSSTALKLHATESATTSPVISLLVNSMIPTTVAAEVAAITPLPPTSITPVPEDSIAKLEVVAAVPCGEPWNAATPPEPLDCISKLQAVAVPSDPWGSIATRSTLATTLLSADELDDDDDDFEDDYEEEESIIPTYCPLRYHPFPTASSPTHQARMGGVVGLAASGISSYVPPHGYGSRPNYYSEPFPQQNCSRTGSPQHMRMVSPSTSPNGFTQWHNGQQFYLPPEAAYPPPHHPQHPQQQQQTIRCAENGKSYLELGCSSPTLSGSNTNSNVIPPPPSAFGAGLHMPPSAVASLDARHPLKRCCDGRGGTWCSTNKNCYKDIRLKIRNLSMFKLSRFRQVSEQSLYRSVLICNTLKRIDREIEAEAKEMHQQAVAHAAQQQQHHLQYQHPLHHHPHHLQHHPHHNLHHSASQSHMLSAQQQPPTLSLLHSQHQQHQDYAPVLSCAQQQQQHHHFQQQQQQMAAAAHYHNQQQAAERLDASSGYMSAVQTSLIQKCNNQHNSYNNNNNINNNSNSNVCDSSGTILTTLTNCTTTLHPYDHYPFRESQSGRATPYPCQSATVISSVPPASVTTPTLLQSSTCNSTAPTTTATTVAISNNINNTRNSNSDSDSGYADDDSTRSINWGSVLSLSSQSALDPLNNNDLFSILPPASTITNPATAVPVVPVPSVSSVNVTTNESNTSSVACAVSISGTFTTAAVNSSILSATSATATTAAASTNSQSSQVTASSSTISSTTATFTTLSTISASTHSSLTSSYVNAVTSSPTSTWEYSFLDMEFGLGSEFTELMPSCKLSSDELFKNSLTPVATSRYSSVHDNDLEQPAHIMVGS